VEVGVELRGRINPDQERFGFFFFYLFFFFLLAGWSHRREGMEENYNPWFRLSYAENISSRSVPMPKNKNKNKKTKTKKTQKTPKTKNPTNPTKPKNTWNYAQTLCYTSYQPLTFNHSQQWALPLACRLLAEPTSPSQKIFFTQKPLVSFW